MMNIFYKSNLLTLFSIAFFACSSSATDNNSKQTIDEPQEVEEMNILTAEEIDLGLQDGSLSTAYFASGCFWCVEAIFQSVDGVVDAVSGYAGGEKSNPTYEEVSRGETKHAEAVKVIFDANKVSYQTLVDVFFGSHDPTTLNQQGPDKGPQYRSIAFYSSEYEKGIIEKHIQKLQDLNTYTDPIVTEIRQFDSFYIAEDYHQEYESNNPENPYVQNVSIPRLNKFKSSFEGLLKESSNH